MCEIISGMDKWLLFLDVLQHGNNLASQDQQIDIFQKLTGLPDDETQDAIEQAIAKGFAEKEIE